MKFLYVALGLLLGAVAILFNGLAWLFYVPAIWILRKAAPSETKACDVPPVPAPVSPPN